MTLCVWFLRSVDAHRAGDGVVRGVLLQLDLTTSVRHQVLRQQSPSQHELEETAHAGLHLGCDSNKVKVTVVLFN